MEETKKEIKGKRIVCDGDVCRIVTDGEEESTAASSSSSHDVNKSGKENPNAGEMTPLDIDTLINATTGKPVNVKEELSKGKVVILYFSASWCPPCRAFSPQLSEFAELNDDNIVVIFISHDHNEGDMMGFVKGKHFLCVPFEDQQTRYSLSNQFGINALPTCAVVHSDGTFITDWGRTAVLKNPENCIEEWKNKEAGISWLQLLKFW